MKIQEMTPREFEDRKDKLVAKHLDMSVPELRARLYILRHQVKVVKSWK